MHVLVTGAGGFIGGHLTRALIAAGHSVTACVRAPERFRRIHPDVTAVGVDFSRDIAVDDWLPRLSGIDAVVNAVGIIRESRGQRFDRLHRATPIALFDACTRAKVHRVVQISALGADASAVSRFHLSKRAADDHLAGLDLPWVILRPSIVYGPGAHSSAFFKALAVLPWVPLIGDGRQPVQPIHVDDLVRAILASLMRDAPCGERIDAVGPAPLPMGELLAHLRRWLGLGPMRSRSIPYPLALRLARFGGLLGGAPITAETVAMLARGSAASGEPFTSHFGFTPRSLDRALAESPAWQADRWHARLYFLRAPLRWSIGLTWVATGLASAGLFPLTDSYALLAAIGLTGTPATVALWSAVALDLGLGLATLVGYRLRGVVAAQVGLMLLYTAIISAWLPEFWLHPFGPVTKNLPLAVATLIMLALEEEK